jgi:hypothetical protein
MLDASERMVTQYFLCGKCGWPWPDDNHGTACHRCLAEDKITNLELRARIDAKRKAERDNRKENHGR